MAKQPGLSANIGTASSAMARLQMLQPDPLVFPSEAARLMLARTLVEQAGVFVNALDATTAKLLKESAASFVASLSDESAQLLSSARHVVFQWLTKQRPEFARPDLMRSAGDFQKAIREMTAEEQFALQICLGMPSDLSTVHGLLRQRLFLVAMSALLPSVDEVARNSHSPDLKSQIQSVLFELMSDGRCVQAAGCFLVESCSQANDVHKASEIISQVATFPLPFMSAAVEAGKYLLESWSARNEHDRSPKVPEKNEWIPLSELPQHLPMRDGKPVHRSRMYAWAKDGLKGVRLKYEQVGGRRCTTMAWFNEFAENLAGADFGVVPQPLVRPRARKSVVPVERAEAIKAGERLKAKFFKKNKTGRSLGKR
jgi:hypothetical protein